MVRIVDANAPQVPDYKPNRVERFIDGLVAAFAPAKAIERDRNRKMLHYFRAKGAQSNGVRPNESPTSSTSGTMMGNRERLQLMWNSIALVEDSGLCASIVSKYQKYVCGTIRYQSRTGSRERNNEYEDYIKTKFGKSIDYTGRRTLRQMAMCGIAGQVYKGDFGLNIVREGAELYVQGIEADRIGNPYEYKATDTYLSGIETDLSGRTQRYHIYNRNRQTGMYRFERAIPAYTPSLGLPNFLFSANPINFDDVRGKTCFATCIDNAAYIESIRRYELEALAWASSQSGVYYTHSGSLPASLPFDNMGVQTDQFGNVLHRFSARPNTITALGIAEKVEMFNHDRTSPNVLSMYRSTVRDIAMGVDLSYAFVYDMSGLAGPAVRACSAQDSRTIESWRNNLTEDILMPLVILELMNGIDRGDIGFDPKWFNGTFLFPAHPTIDVGRESQANINENRAGLNAGATIASESGEDIEEIHDKLADEGENKIRLAMERTKKLGLEDWREVYHIMYPGSDIAMSPQFEAARAENLQQQADNAQQQIDNANRQQDQATGLGVELDADEMRVERERDKHRQEFTFNFNQQTPEREQIVVDIDDKGRRRYTRKALAATE